MPSANSNGRWVTYYVPTWLRNRIVINHMMRSQSASYGGVIAWGDNRRRRRTNANSR